MVPGDTLLVHVEKELQRGNVWRFSGKAVAGVLVTEATYAAMIRDIDTCFRAREHGRVIDVMLSDRT